MLMLLSTTLLLLLPISAMVAAAIGFGIALAL